MTREAETKTTEGVKRTRGSETRTPPRVKWYKRTGNRAWAETSTNRAETTIRGAGTRTRRSWNHHQRSWTLDQEELEPGLGAGQVS